MERDIQLDMYRSIIMIYIVCIVHVLHWLDFGTNTIKSIVLFEMPIIFFISGAAVKVSHSQKTVLQTFKNRFKRIVLPYYIYIIYSIIFLFLIAILSTYLNKDIETNKLLNIKWYDYLNMITMKEGKYLPLGASHLWFLIPYFLISISTPIQIKIIEKIPKPVYLLINLGILILITNRSFSKINLERYTLGYYIATYFGYNLFYLIGLFYYRNIKLKYIQSILVFSACIFGIIIFPILTRNNNIVMQDHKFPPDIIFFLYGIIALCFCSIIFTFIKIPSNRILRFWNKNGYELFLYQNFAYWVLYLLSSSLNLNIVNNFLNFLGCSLSIFLLSMSLIVIKKHLEKCFINKIISLRATN